LVLRILQSVILRDVDCDCCWRWRLSLVSSKDGGRFLMHARVVEVGGGVAASAAWGVVMMNIFGVRPFPV